MNILINNLVNWFKARPLLTTIAAGFLVIALVVVLLYYGARLTNSLTGWWYGRGTDQAHEQIDKLTTEAIKAKGVAEEAMKALAEEKKVTAAEKAKRELAEQLLNDKTKTANEKLAIYEATIKQSPTVTEPTTDVGSLCARAKSLGIDCQ
jgi:hypothetical protein